MILLDSVFINNSGGKLLLDYLVKELEDAQMNVFYLFDIRYRNSFTLQIPSDRKLFVEPSLYKRHKFYQKNKSKFSKVFCFGNIAPTLKLSCPVYTYFHQRLFLSVPNTVSFKESLLLKIKSYIFKKCIKNTDILIVQTQNIKIEALQSIPSLKDDMVKVISFYEPLNYSNITREKNTFLYVSSGPSHKNHKILIEAFKEFYNKNKVGKLLLTIGNEFVDLINEIETSTRQGYPIINLGFIDREKLSDYYSGMEYFVYPSLSESFGLGIIEAVEGGCKIIGADLEYLHNVCEPSLVFNPQSKPEIISCFEKAVTHDLKESKSKVNNNIQELLMLLKQ